MKCLLGAAILAALSAAAQDATSYPVLEESFRDAGRHERPRFLPPASPTRLPPDSRQPSRNEYPNYAGIRARSRHQNCRPRQPDQRLRPSMRDSSIAPNLFSQSRRQLLASPLLPEQLAQAPRPLPPRSKRLLAA